MKILIFSDIHGNSDTLNSLLRENIFYDCDVHIFLGDILGYYYNFKECIELLEDIPNLISVRGNHDQFYIDSFHDIRLTNHLAEKYGSSYRKKDGDVYRYLMDIPIQQKLMLDGIKILIQHGTPWDLLNGRIYPDTEIRESYPYNLILCGHTHYMMERKEYGSLWLNPGSLGQARDGKGFSYCIFDTKTFHSNFYTIKIDLDKLVEQAKEYDLKNEYLIKVLYRNGR